MLTAANSRLDIYNMALSRIGVRARVTSLDSLQDDSQEAAYCGMFWHNCRKLLLQGFPWKFALRSMVLEEASPALSAVELVGTGPALIAPYLDTPIDVPGNSPLIEGTFEVMIRVVQAGGAGVGRVQASLDGGVTWGASISYAGAQTLALGSPLLPVGAGKAWAGRGRLFVEFLAGATLEAGAVYRFFATDCKSVEYRYAYWLPDALLDARGLWPGTRAPRATQRIPWARGTFGDLEVLWTDAEPAQNPTLKYVEDAVDAAKFPSGFANALAWRLAFDLNGPLKGRPAPQDLWNAYLLAINEARSIDFIEAQEDLPPDSETVAARGYAWTPYGTGGVPPPGGWSPY